MTYSEYLRLKDECHVLLSPADDEIACQLLCSIYTPDEDNPEHNAMVYATDDAEEFKIKAKLYLLAVKYFRENSAKYPIELLQDSLAIEIRRGITSTVDFTFYSQGFNVFSIILKEEKWCVNAFDDCIKEKGSIDERYKVEHYYDSGGKRGAFISTFQFCDNLSDIERFLPRSISVIEEAVSAFYDYFSPESIALRKEIIERVSRSLDDLPY